MTTNITLYHFPPSAPSRGALMAARAVGVPVKLEIVNLFKKEQLSDSFTAINPQHCVPTLVEDDFVLWESRAIAGYLVDKFAKDDLLYSKELKKRALINQRLYFDSSNLYVKIRAICFPIIFMGERKIDETKKNDLNISLDFLNKFLTDSKWLAGEHYTIADMSIFASLSSILAVGWDISSYTNLVRWVKECDVLPGFEENQEGANEFGAAVKKNMDPQ